MSCARPIPLEGGGGGGGGGGHSQSANRYLTRAYPGSEFVVANTLAKWKKLEPSEIYFSQGFSQKVVTKSCFIHVFNSLPARGDFVDCS